MYTEIMMNPEAMEVSVVLPCLNEESTIGRCVQAAKQALDGAGLSGEVIVADNDSVDGSREQALEHGARVVEVKYPGYGNAVRAGMKSAHGRFLIFLDADLSYDFADIPRFVEELRKGADVVIGSRFRGGIDPGAMPTSHRLVGTPAMTLLANLLFGCGISDINCGMRGLTREAFERLGLHSEGMEFASEMVVKAAQAGLRIREVPIQFHVDQRGRSPHLRSFRDAWRHLQLMMHYCSVWVFLLPGLFFTLGGFAAIVAAPGSLAGLTSICLAGLFSVTLGMLILLLGLTAQGHIKGNKYTQVSSKPMFRFVRRWVRVETGVFLGLLVMLLGGVFLVYAALHMRHASPSMDVVAFKGSFIGAAVFISGLEVFFASLLMGLFGIRVADDEWRDSGGPGK